jgi:hypothetical protein
MSRRHYVDLKRISKKKFFQLLKHTDHGKRSLLLGLVSAVKLEKDEAKVTVDVDVECDWQTIDQAVLYVKGRDFVEQLAITQIPLALNQGKWVAKKGEPIDVVIIKESENTYHVRCEEGHKPQAKINRVFVREDVEVEDVFDEDKDDVFRTMGIVDEDGDYLHQE